MYAREDKKKTSCNSRAVWNSYFLFKELLLSIINFKQSTPRCAAAATPPRTICCTTVDLAPLTVLFRFRHMFLFLLMCVCNKKCMLRAHNSSSHSNHFLCCILYFILYSFVVGRLHHFSYSLANTHKVLYKYMYNV